MNKKNNSKVIFIISTIVLILGIWQLILYIPAQMDLIKNAMSQGATSQQVSMYMWQQFIPQLITFVITTLGMVVSLISIGIINSKVDYLISMKNINDHVSLNSHSLEEDKNIANDDFLDDFEIVIDNNK